MTDNENPAPAGEPERVPDEAQVHEPKPEPQRQQLPARQPMQAGAHPMAIVPRTYEEAWRISMHFVASGLAPRDIMGPKRNNDGRAVERAQLVQMAGLEVGLPPIAAFNNIAIINSKPRIWGAAVPALAIATGQLAAWEESVTGEGDDMVARCKVARRLANGAVVTQEAEFSVGDAKRAGLWQTEAKVERMVWEDGARVKRVVDNDSPWFKYPKRMMRMRTRQAITDLFSDAFCGLGVAEAYVGPGTDAEMRDVTPVTVDLSEDVVENPLGGDDLGASAEPVTEVHPDAHQGSRGRTGGATPPTGASNETAKTDKAPEAPEEPVKEPEPKKAAKPRAAKKDAPAAAAREPEAKPGAKPVAPPAHPDTLAYPPDAARARWTFDHYFTFVRQWVGLAVEAAGKIEGFLPETYIKNRWESAKEKTLRNNLGVALTAEQREEALTYCRDAVNKIKAAAS